jgi:hypothetical protein
LFKSIAESRACLPERKHAVLPVFQAGGRGLFLARFLVLLLVSSCATFPRSELPPGAAVSAGTPEAVLPRWRPLDWAAGGAAAYCAGRIKNPRLVFHALRIDLAAPGLRIVVRSGGPGGGGARSTRVSSFVRDNGLLAGINAVPFDPSSAREGEPRTNVGLVVSNGKLLSPSNPRFDALVWYAGSGPVIVSQAETGGGAGIENAVGGFHRILRAGELTPRALSRRKRFARSAVGLSVPGRSGEPRFLYLLVIDGGRLFSPGATEAETALLLRALGAEEGLNLDGGGSSALALRGSGGAVHLLNTPVHDGILGRERAVAGCLGVGAGE